MSKSLITSVVSAQMDGVAERAATTAVIAANTAKQRKNAKYGPACCWLGLGYLLLLWRPAGSFERPSKVPGPLPFQGCWRGRCQHDVGSLNTAIPALGFEGHFTAAVSRGPAPGRSHGWRGPAFDRSYACTPELLTMTFFFCFLRSDRTKTGVCLLFFLLRSLRLTKTVLKPKKGHASALPASVAGSSYLSSSKVKNKDRWTTNGIDRTVSVEQTERASSHKD